jgi:hypothetical protein
MTALLTNEPTGRSAEPLAATKGWHRDPEGRHDLRYHDGHHWTEHVTHFGPVPCTGCAAH